MIPTPESIEAAEMDDDADAALGRTIEAKLGAAPARPELPREEGPRRTLLVVLAAAAGLVLLWLLFRSVPEPQPGAGGPAVPSKSEVVEDIANASDPSWMNADTAGVPRLGGPGALVPPVYSPAGTTPGATDTSLVGGTAPGVPPQAPTQQQPLDQEEGQPAPDPRREAFRSALRSRPLQSGAGAGLVNGTTATEQGEIPPPPGLREMEAAADAEAARRTAAASGEEQGGFAVPGPSPSGGAATAAAGGTRSSYANGGSAPAPQGAPQHLLAGPAPRRPEQLVVPVGSIIEGQLHTAVVSDLPGHVVGMVTGHVYDAGQRTVVIPMYSWLFGTYESDVVAGQGRLVVQWTSVRFPDGRTYALPALRASDPAGASGLRGRVNNHYGTVFGHAVLSSVIAAAFVGRADDGSAATRSTREAVADAAAQQLGQTASEVTRRNLDIKPTITVARLTRFSIVLDRDLVFTPPPRD